MSRSSYFRSFELAARSAFVGSCVLTIALIVVKGGVGFLPIALLGLLVPFLAGANWTLWSAWTLVAVLLIGMATFILQGPYALTLALVALTLASAAMKSTLTTLQQVQVA